VIAAQVCFSEDVIDGALMARLLSDHELGFTPSVLSCDRFRDARWGPKALERLASTGRFGHASAHEADHDGYFSVVRAGGLQMQQLTWQPVRPDVLEDAVESITRLPGLIAAYLSDDQDAFWQSETGIDAYEQANRPHEHLPKVEGGQLPWETESVDVSRHWGRRIAFADFWLWAAATMWFGPGTLKWLDRERLLALPVGEVTERDDGVVRVDLFPLDWFERNLDEARERQRVFWEWMGLGALEAVRSEQAVDHEPDVDIEPGAFEHGGTRRITEWLGLDGRSRRGSEAGWRRRTELGRDGAVVHQETASAASNDV
jgi:hypothetical protein